MPLVRKRRTHDRQSSLKREIAKKIWRLRASSYKRHRARILEWWGFCREVQRPGLVSFNLCNKRYYNLPPASRAGWRKSFNRSTERRRGFVPSWAAFKQPWQYRFLTKRCKINSSSFSRLFRAMAKEFSLSRTTNGRQRVTFEDMHVNYWHHDPLIRNPLVTYLCYYHRIR